MKHPVGRVAIKNHVELLLRSEAVNRLHQGIERRLETAVRHAVGVVDHEHDGFGRRLFAEKRHARLGPGSVALFTEPRTERLSREVAEVAEVADRTHIADVDRSGPHIDGIPKGDGAGGDGRLDGGMLHFKWLDMLHLEGHEFIDHLVVGDGRRDRHHRFWLRRSDGHQQCHREHGDDMGDHAHGERRSGESDDPATPNAGFWFLADIQDRRSRFLGDGASLQTCCRPVPVATS